MIRNLAEKIGHSLIHGGMPEENFEIYAYGAECFLNLFISEILLLTFGLFTHRLPEILLWDISFMLLRRQIGGYHAHSHFSCIICSTQSAVSVCCSTHSGNTFQLSDIFA